jgi:hypothetical protein
MSEGVLVYTCVVHRYYLGVQKGQQVIFRKKSSSEQNSSWRNIKIKYCIVWKKEKEKEKLYLFIKKEHNFY